MLTGNPINTYEKLILLSTLKTVPKSQVTPQFRNTYTFPLLFNNNHSINPHSSTLTVGYLYSHHHLIADKQLSITVAPLWNRSQPKTTESWLTNATDSTCWNLPNKIKLMNSLLPWLFIQTSTPHLCILSNSKTASTVFACKNFGSGINTEPNHRPCLQRPGIKRCPRLGVLGAEDTQNFHFTITNPKMKFTVLRQTFWIDAKDLEEECKLFRLDQTIGIGVDSAEEQWEGTDRSI